jgi:Lrp/AsnC family transcriptional regulator, regulator for asnA, asnC and gidA
MSGEGRSGRGIRLDGIDRRIIEELQVDGRRPFSRIAENLGVGEGAVRHRVKRLEAAGILQIVGIADPLKIGYGTMALIGIRVRPGFLSDVSRSIGSLPETSYVAMVTGAFDLFAEVICRDLADFTALLTERLYRIEGIMASESFMILQLHKLSYRWGAGLIEPAADPRLSSGNSLVVDERRASDPGSPARMSE